MVDDNVINQRLASALLEARGHTVKVVGDGQEALEALGDASFDLVLMDIQMPILDGVDATRSIRAGEQWTGKHVPIIAITAHAMKGDRERFLTAGMDAYVSKPVDAAVLFETIERLLHGGDASGLPPIEPAANTVPEAPAPEVLEAPAVETPVDQPLAAAESPVATAIIEGAVINRDVALEKLGGDADLLVEIIDLYLEDSPKVLDKLRAEVAAGDAEGIWKSAHRLKGSVGRSAFRAARRSGRLTGSHYLWANPARPAGVLLHAAGPIIAPKSGRVLSSHTLAPARFALEPGYLISLRRARSRRASRYAG